MPADRGDRETVALLLERGANIEAQYTHGITALMYAAYADKTGTVALLLERGADIEAKNIYGTTALTPDFRINSLFFLSCEC